MKVRERESEVSREGESEQGRGGEMKQRQRGEGGREIYECVEKFDICDVRLIACLWNPDGHLLSTKLFGTRSPPVFSWISSSTCVLLFLFFLAIFGDSRNLPCCRSQRLASNPRAVSPSCA